MGCCTFPSRAQCAIGVACVAAACVMEPRLALIVWDSYLDEHGRTYYVNTATSESRWTLPAVHELAALHGAEQHWARLHDAASGAAYYCSLGTGESQWEHPEHVAFEWVGLGEHGACDPTSARLRHCAAPVDASLSPRTLSTVDAGEADDAADSQDLHSSAESHSSGAESGLRGEQAAGAALDSEWEATVDVRGLTCWYNSKTHATVYERPVPLRQQREMARLRRLGGEEAERQRAIVQLGVPPELADGFVKGPDGASLPPRRAAYRRVTLRGRPTQASSTSRAPRLRT